MTTFGDLFTDRQLVALTTFSDLVQEARTHVEQDALAAGLSATRAAAYADAVATYLGMAVSRLSDIFNALCIGKTPGHRYVICLPGKPSQCFGISLSQTHLVAQPVISV